jgi:hypothetical protein
MDKFAYFDYFECIPVIPVSGNSFLGGDFFNFIKGFNSIPFVCYKHKIENCFFIVYLRDFLPFSQESFSLLKQEFLDSDVFFWSSYYRSCDHCNYWSALNEFDSSNLCLYYISPSVKCSDPELLSSWLKIHLSLFDSVIDFNSFPVFA